MYLPPVLSLLLCALFVALSSSVPTSESHADQQLLLNTNNPSSQSTETFLSRICGGLIEAIWPHYKTSSSKTSKLLPRPASKFRSRYDDDVVLRFKVKSEEEAKQFAEAVDTLFLDVWEASKDWADVRVSKKVLPSFLTLLPPSMQQSHTPIITQLSKAVLDTFPSIGNSQDERYRHASDRTQLFTIGTSYEGRDIPALRVGVEPRDDDPHEGGKRQTIVLMAGSHAREWISTSTATYLLRGLLHNFDPRRHDLIDKLLTHYDFVFIPVLNPDGYEYTWTTDRLWRKNRQDTSLPFCRGIDLDRSFPVGWDGDTQVDNPCSESYAGEHPLQAIEAQRLAEWTKNETEGGKTNFAAFIDLHSYSQEILYPYSYTCDKEPHNLEDLEEVAIGLAKAFRLTNGHYYDVDSACEGSVTLTTPGSTKGTEPIKTKLEESGGSALDFFYQNVTVKYAFQVKLRDTGSYGFLLPKDNIVPTGIEAFNAFLALGKWMLGDRGIENYTNLSSDEIWGQEEVVVGEVSDTNETDDADEDEDSFWWRRRRR
ncbi:putative metallocarboxypeptidase ecm14 [Exophiala xenobiotica]|uniref:Inactive metallocarboxypeptidase ECM14 n=1 Tax=Lithohypha guttulata TaxID=1690604 RepID=A0ABR0JW83_9EURO|nr:putative metallocarboxypeptidase ecm14 [Lithohypha guttulata]KAK5310024.1 putative metallocarboxypeptidase ecm14 [Exophiala xenobiotica]